MEKIITDNAKYVVTKLALVHQQKCIDGNLSMYQVFPVCFDGPYAISAYTTNVVSSNPAHGEVYMYHATRFNTSCIISTFSATFT